jgi:NAD(P)-dependent dehydrogenase (short-subunit alcohol dehydrogenase family)
VLARAVDAALDASILLSWDRTGFRRHSRHFDAADLAVELSGCSCLVTGANAGLGRATAAGLARRGARVALLCRNEERGREAERALRAETGSRELFYVPLDVADLASVRACAARLAGERVDLLVHNAGVLPAERQETRDGLELTFATHVAGPWLLTHLLEPALRRAGAARVLFVSSGGMYAARLSCDDVAWRSFAAATRRRSACRSLAELLADPRAMARSLIDAPLADAGMMAHAAFSASRARSSAPERCHISGRATTGLAASGASGSRAGRTGFDRERGQRELRRSTGALASSTRLRPEPGPRGERRRIAEPPGGRR